MPSRTLWYRSRSSKKNSLGFPRPSNQSSSSLSGKSRTLESSTWRCSLEKHNLARRHWRYPYSISRRSSHLKGRILSCVTRRNNRPTWLARRSRLKACTLSLATLWTLWTATIKSSVWPTRLTTVYSCKRRDKYCQARSNRSFRWLNGPNKNTLVMMRTSD